MGLSLDFTGLSTLLLGQAQPAQFQSGDQYGNDWRWGSLKNESLQLLDGSELVDVGTAEKPNNIPSNHTANNTSAIISGSDWAENNANAEMPRGYHEETVVGYGDYYNWYATTAETGTYSQTSGDASDSLCPAGWQLPVNGGSNNTTDKSWRKLLFSTTEGYGLDSSEASSAIMRQQPLSLPFSGFYNWASGFRNDRESRGNFWASTADSKTYARHLGFYSLGVSPATSNSKSFGFGVRCVQK